MKFSDNEDAPSYEELFRDSDDDDNEDYDEDSVEESGRRFTLEELEKRKAKRIWVENRRKVLFEYSQFSFFGESIAWTFFKLSWKMSKDSTELLWLAIVGIFDMYLTGKIDLSKFEEYCDSLKSHLKRLSHLKNDVNLFGSEDNSVDDILNIPLGKRSCITITQQKDLQLNLYRHWSLFESLRHTMVVSCKFKVWNIKGHKRLLEFLAELGVPLTQCKQNYSSMDFELRKNILQWVDDLSEKYSLDRIIGETFIANYGYKHRLPAGDVAHGVRALLESPAKELTMKEKFMKALDAFSWSNTSILMEGIELAKTQLIAILKQVHDIIDMKGVISSGPFLHVIISESAPDAKLFCFPCCLIVLARYLLTAYIACSKKRRVVNLPLVVITPDLSSPGYGFAAGIPPLAEDSPRNLFGKAFIQAGQMMNCQMEPSLYDLSVVKFAYNERSNLLEALISLLS